MSSTMDDPQPGSSKAAGTRCRFVQDNENGCKRKGKAKAVPTNELSIEGSENEEFDDTSSVLTSGRTSPVSIPSSTQSETADATEKTASTITQESRQRHVRPKVATVRRYLKNADRGCSKCKRRNVQFGATSSTINRHFSTKHPSAWEEMTQQHADSVWYVPYGHHEIARVEALKEALIRWIIADQRPFSTVDGAAFRYLVSQLDPRFQVPCRQTITRHVFTEFEARAFRLRSYFTRESSKVSITTNIWSACNQQSFLGMMVHWIDMEWRMHAILLDIIPLNESHTGDLIAQKVCEVLRLYGLGERLLGVTTDNGTNMISMAGKLRLQCLEEFDNSQVTHLCCAAHVLNLSVKEGLSMVSAPVKKARAFVSRLRNSPVNKRSNLAADYPDQEDWLVIRVRIRILRSNKKQKKNKALTHKAS